MSKKKKANQSKPTRYKSFVYLADTKHGNAFLPFSCTIAILDLVSEFTHDGKTMLLAKVPKAIDYTKEAFSSCDRITIYNPYKNGTIVFPCFDMGEPAEIVRITPITKPGYDTPKFLLIEYKSDDIRSFPVQPNSGIGALSQLSALCGSTPGIDDVTTYEDSILVQDKINQSYKVIVTKFIRVRKCEDYEFFTIKVMDDSSFYYIIDNFVDKCISFDDKDRIEMKYSIDKVDIADKTIYLRAFKKDSNKNE